MTRRVLPAFLLASAALFTLTWAGCSPHRDPWHDAPTGQKRVLCVTPALHCFTQNVGGDKAYSLCLLTKKGPHDYEPTGDDALKARKADLFLANGLELDNFVAKVAVTSGNKSLKIVKVAEELPHEDLRHPDHDHGEEGHHGHDHGDHDPHAWLSPSKAKKLSLIIAEKLSSIDPANQETYRKNAAAYGAKLDLLSSEGMAAFKDKKNKKIITMHDSMGYFADEFGLTVAATIHVKAGQEAEPRWIQQLLKKCREENVTVICVEPQFPRGAAETIQSSLKAQGVDIKIVDFDPLETEAPGETIDAGYYERRMRANIKNLAEALP